MKTYFRRPVRTNLINQRFGESKLCIDGDNKLVGKVDGVCPTMTIDLYKSRYHMDGHNGIDFGIWYNKTLEMGEPTYFAGDFPAWTKTEYDDAGGIGVDCVSLIPILKCNEPGCDEVHYIKERHWHLSKPMVADGTEVLLGDLVGKTGNTGVSSGPHLHWAPKWCDKQGNGIHKDNGFFGAINIYKHPDLAFENVFVLDVLNLKQQLTLLEKVVKLYQQLISWNRY